MNSCQTVPRKLVIAFGLLAVIALSLANMAAGGGQPRHSAATEARGLSSSLGGLAARVRRSLRPSASRLAGTIPAEAQRLEALSGPSATTEAQVGIALDQLQQMSALRVDPHYLPALVAVGRAYLAATGADPLTGTALDPSYSGLGAELTASALAVRQRAKEAAELSTRIERLSKALAGSKRRARRLQREIGHPRAIPGAAGP